MWRPTSRSSTRSPSRPAPAPAPPAPPAPPAARGPCRRHGCARSAGHRRAPGGGAAAAAPGPSRAARHSSRQPLALLARTCYSSPHVTEWLLQGRGCCDADMATDLSALDTAQRLLAAGAGVVIELIANCLRLGATLAEIPVRWRDVPGSSFSVWRH